jgi:hypothetical protein
MTVELPESGDGRSGTWRAVALCATERLLGSELGGSIAPFSDDRRGRPSTGLGHTRQAASQAASETTTVTPLVATAVQSGAKDTMT